MEEQNQNFNVQQELEVLASAVQKAAENRLGSFSQRNPLLGKMIRCPYCRQRRRVNAQQSCCSASYRVTHESAPRVKKRKNPRLTRNNPPLFNMRQVLLELEEEPLLIDFLNDEINGLSGFHTPQKQVEMHHLASFVEKMLIRKRKATAKKKRDQQKLSRRINRDRN